MSRSVKASVDIPKTGDEGPQFASNQVLTAYRSILLFIPVCLVRQYVKPLSLYFLVVMALTFIKAISADDPLPNFMATMTVLSLAVVREVLQERAAQREDKRLNSQVAQVNRKGVWTSTKWADVIVGDVVLITGNSPAPADVVIVASSAAGNSAYIQTTNLDGESNFKPRFGIDKAIETLDQMTSETHQGARPEIVIHAAPPRSDLDWFEGQAVFHHPGQAKAEVESLTIKNFVPREAVVRGADWIVAVVVYTGKDTKVLLGNQSRAYKTSKIDRITSKLVVAVMAIQICFSTLTLVMGLVVGQETYWFLAPALPASKTTRSIQDFFAALYSVTLLIPVSLIISVEIAKQYQAALMRADVAIPGTLTPSKALNDDLGQIGFVLSDKTGTLTSNELQLKVATVAGVHYPDLHSLAAVAAANPDVDVFLSALSLCHDVTPAFAGDVASASARTSIGDMQRASRQDQASLSGRGVTSNLSFCAESPDEMSIVFACSDVLGRTLTKRSQSSMTIRVGHEVKVIKIVKFFAFDNSRRRSSIVVQDSEEQYTVFVKGSDDAVMPRCVPGAHSEATQDSLNRYAKQSLRTLVFASKKITKKDFDSLVTKCAGDTAMLVEKIETDLTLLGCTGTEDRLQDGVPETIERLRIAGIGVWMITGDKLDTAVEISKSANLVTPNMRVVTIDITEQDKEGPVKAVAALQQALESDQPVAAVVTGRSIRFFIDEFETPFMTGLMRCKSVVVCRSTKDQKAQMVELLQTAVNGSVLVLAIGDGANDVPMIKKGDVGIGIAGKEGRQAAQNADYVITQFSHLERLLLFHGRLNYVRTSKMVLYFLFKNLVIALPFILNSAIGTLHSASPLISAAVTLSFNTILTAVPVFALGLTERDVAPDDRLVDFENVTAKQLAQAYPKLYMTGRLNRMFSIKLLVGMFFAALLAGLWIYTCTMLPLSDMQALDAAGHLAGRGGLSDLYFMAVFTVDTAAIVLISEGITAPMIWAIVYSCCACVSFMVSDATDPSSDSGLAAFELAANTFMFIPITMLAAGPPILIGVAVKVWRYRFNPSARMVWQQAKALAVTRMVARKHSGTPGHYMYKVHEEGNSVSKPLLAME